MKAFKIIALSAGLVLADGAYAQSIQADRPASEHQFNNDVEQPSFPIEPFDHPKTRDEVVQEFQAARTAGRIWQGESDNRIPAAGRRSTASRAQVLKELDEARSAGLLSEGELNYRSAS